MRPTWRVGVGLARALLTHPLAWGIDPDGPDAAQVHRELITTKPLLRRVYEDWYASIRREIPTAATRVLEIGSGSGFLAESLPQAITSDVRAKVDVRLRLDASQLPFGDASLETIVILNVLHHVGHPRQALREVARTLVPGGRLVMIEPWVSPWSSLVYGRLHHERFDTGSPQWEFPSGQPMASANGALPWIIFQRDRARFEREFPTLRLDRIAPGWPLSYLLSGGVSLRSLVPSVAVRVVQRLECMLDPVRWSMFALIVLRRREAARGP